MIRLTRRYRFCASHRLYATSLTDAENFETFGKCSNPFGHGHDYVLEVAVSGELNRVTGQLVAVGILDELVAETVIRPLDRRDLNTEAPEFSAMVPTSENLVLAIEERLRMNWSDRIPPGVALRNVSLHETRRNRFDVRR